MVLARVTPMQRVMMKSFVHALCLMPLAWLFYLAWQEQTLGNGALGADPIATIEHELGIWALRFLLIALAVTPLKQLTGVSEILRYRRLLGLYAFAYASFHFAAFLFLDLKSYWSQIVEEIIKRPYITVGFAAWVILLLLAITSTRGWQRRLAKRWTYLHRAVYAAAILAVLHFWWLVKSDIREPLLYAIIAAALLGWRLWRRARTNAVRKQSIRSPAEKSTHKLR